MSREFTIVNKERKTGTDVIANKVTVDPSMEEIRFHGNTKHNYNGLVSFLNITLKTAIDKNNVRPNFAITVDDEQNIVSARGDCEYVVNVCKDIGLFDEHSAEDMINYLNNQNKCTIL